MTYRVTKVYGHDLGLSCAFRQWRATSHCSFLHGYSLSFEFIFESEELDDKGWVIDFGGLKELKEDLVNNFDHKLLVAGDDPELNKFLQMHNDRLADVSMLPSGVGCEQFARTAWWMAWGVVQEYNRTNGTNVGVVSCKCSEHGANSATYIGKE